jgi:hypothetical protein
MEFIWILFASIVGVSIWFGIIAIRLRAANKDVTVKAITAALSETDDDPDEPARWIP